ncbi:hypothetical protein QBC41DRAFT_69238 [Cercophora samala]|uniref:Ricin B lectin domain-containing protein n=1 Tax=Cercophora samala TaxID=330535 RepID=A0AA40DEH1_9PEZI|nr:hypothetical protein QBC41DRAFT_69238 [Cercophora samala]
MVSSLASLLAWAAVVGASPFVRNRAVDSLNEEATAEAHQRDNGATRAFSNVEIRTSDGKCLFVDELSGDFRANLTPVQVADCGSTDGQGWDIITAGDHIRGDGVALIVSSLTNACLNFDSRRQAGNQLLLFSCGGRADGGGDVTDSQLFDFDGSAGPLSLSPQNEGGSFCATVRGNTLDIVNCQNGDASQTFTIGGGAPAGGNNGGNNDNSNNGGNNRDNGNGGNGGSVTVTPTAAPSAAPAQSTTAAPAPAPAPAPGAGNGNNNGGNNNNNNGDGGGNNNGNGNIPSVNPTEPVPVSRAGGTLQPTAAAQSHQRDDGATRAFSDVTIRAPNNKCLFIDPTAGDFRQNLIPVSLVDCTGSPNEKFDVITAGKHNNNRELAALIVSTLTQGCISVDLRRQPGDTVTLFSCGGRADGEGETDGAQLFPFLGQTSFALAPQNERNQTCVVPGNERLETGPCATDGSELFSIFE